MKRKNILISMLLFAMPLFSTEAGNVVKNSGFEEITPQGKAKHWISYGGGYEVSEDNINDDGKTNICITGNGKSSGLYQVIYGNPTGKYRLSVEIYPMTFTAGIFHALYVTVVKKDKTTKFLQLKDLTPGNVTIGKFMKIEALLDLSKYDGAIGHFGIWSLCNKDFKGIVFIDNLMVMEEK